MGKTVLAHDLGTGGNKASVFDVDGRCIATTFVPYATSYPRAGWHEQRPEDWWRAVVESTRQLLARQSVDARQIECIAVSGHSLGCVPLDSEGRLLRELTPIWSDQRPGRQVEEFFERTDPAAWYRTTGNGFPPAHYTVFKVMWYRDREPDLFRRIASVIGTKDYVNLRLTGRVRTDFSYASGSGVYDLLGWKYSEELIRASGLPAELFPEVCPSTEILDTLTPSAASVLGLPRSVRVAAGGVDNSCMALGARNTAEGRVYASLGSSAWIAVSSRRPLLDERSRPYVFTHVVPGMYTSAVAIFSSGTSFRWVRDTLCAHLVAEAQEDGGSAYDKMTALAATSPAGARRLLFNPSLAGGSSLEASPHIRGAFLGLDLHHSLADVIRSAMEGIAMNLRLALDELRRIGEVGDEILAVGGSSRSGLWRQILADALRTRLVKTQVGQEAGSLGAAAVAAVAAGLWKDFSRIDEIHRVEHVATPIPANAATYESLLDAFRETAADQARLGERLARLHSGSG